MGGLPLGDRFVPQGKDKNVSPKIRMPAIFPPTAKHRPRGLHAVDQTHRLVEPDPQLAL